MRSLKVSSLGNGLAKGCGIYHLALVLKPRNLIEHRSDQRAFSFGLAGSGNDGRSGGLALSSAQRTVALCIILVPQSVEHVKHKNLECLE